MATHYDALGVTPGAPLEVIRAAFKAAALAFHPDRMPRDASDEACRAAEQRFRECVAAAKCLLDPVARARYDATATTVTAIEVAGRVSDECGLDEFERVDGAAQASGGAALYVRECRCGGSYTLVTDGGDASADTAKRYATCDCCSLTIAVRVR
jgi:DnaJ-class molecular chaperone